MQGQLDLLAEGLDAQWEAIAEQIAARLVRRRGVVVAHKDGEAAQEGDYQRVEVIGPRSVGAEPVALEARCGHGAWSASAQNWG